MKFSYITLFPELIHSYFHVSLVGKSWEKGLITPEVINLREFGIGKHKAVDDSPFGGGPGMLLRVDCLVNAIESIQGFESATKILLCPSGKTFQQSTAKRIQSQSQHLILICGRYEGFDARISDYIDERLSLGEFILMGGELAALAISETIIRKIPGVLGNEESPVTESFSDELKIEYDQFTKPPDFRGKRPPEVLLSGNHKMINEWRKQNADSKIHPNI